MGVESRTAVTDGDAVFVNGTAVVASGICGGKVMEEFASSGSAEVFTGDPAGGLQAASKDISRSGIVIRLMHHLPGACAVSHRAVFARSTKGAASNATA